MPEKSSHMPGSPKNKRVKHVTIQEPEPDPSPDAENDHYYLPLKDISHGRLAYVEDESVAGAEDDNAHRGDAITTDCCRADSTTAIVQPVDPAICKITKTDGAAESPPAHLAGGSPQPHLWVGRTKAQVDRDNIRLAVQEGVYHSRVTDSNIDSRQSFWVVELNGDLTLRSLKCISESLQPGRWQRDAHYGNDFFIREARLDADS